MSNSHSAANGQKYTVTVYEPDKAIRNGYIALWKEMLSEVKNSRWLTFQLFSREIKALYKQSFIGILWPLITPFIALGTFFILSTAGVVSLGEIDVPYPIYAILGLAFWQIFASGLVSSTGSLVRAGTMISKINFPRESLVVGSLGQALIAFAIQVLVLIVFFAIWGFIPHWMTIFIPLMFFPVLLFTLGLGMILALVNGIARDIERIIGVVTSFLLFLTPIMYAKPISGALGEITKFNPMYYLISGPRDLALNGSLSEPIGYLVTVLLSMVLFIVAWMVFHLTETRISERI